MNIPETLNGYPVIRAARHRDCVTILCDRGDSFVVATWWPDLGDSWQWGHYSHGQNARIEALESFATVAARNDRR